MRSPRLLVAAGCLAVAGLLPAGSGALAGDLPAGPVQAAGSDPARPRTGVAVSFDSRRLALFDTSTGREVRRLSEDDGGDVAWVSGPALSPDGRTVYYAANVGDSTRIHRRPVAGGKAEGLAAGWAPQPSPDGRFLAYGYSDALSPCVSDGLSLLDLSTGSERRFADPGTPPDPVTCDGGGTVEHISWASDSRRLAFATDAGPSGDVRILDTATADDLGDARILDPAPAEGYTSPAWLPDGRIVVAESGAAGADHRIVAVDPATGAKEVVVPGVGRVDHIDADRSGAHLILTTLLDGGRARIYMGRLDGTGVQVVRPWSHAVW